jgi:hypothetical protein
MMVMGYDNLQIVTAAIKDYKPFSGRAGERCNRRRKFIVIV